MNLNELIPIVKINKKELYNIFENMLLSSNISIKHIDYLKSNIKKYTLLIDDRLFYVTILIKNITDCGWDDRKYLRRIQTTPMYDLEKTSSNSCFLLCGLAFYAEEPILVIWNAQNYVYHRSNRSCYVDLSSIKKAFDNSFYFGLDSNQYVYACDRYSIKKLIFEFINDNYSDEILL